MESRATMLAGSCSADCGEADPIPVLGQRRLGKRHYVTVASGATLDYFFPELIEIHDNTIIGMNSMILTHEFLHDRWRRGRVVIGKGVMVGANSTVLAGVEIGD